MKKSLQIILIIFALYFSVVAMLFWLIGGISYAKNIISIGELFNVFTSMGIMELLGFKLLEYSGVLQEL